MRCFLPFLALALAIESPAFAQAPPPYCTGSCQTKPMCTQGTTTTVTGTMYAPNGVDPLPGVTVYIAGAAVGPLTAGVTCPVPGAIPLGTPLAGAVTAFDGTFTIPDAPVNTAGQPEALVMVSGKWRRIIPIDLSGGACTTTALPAAQTRFPRNQSEGDIPKFAVATGNADPVECVLYKVLGNDPTEFTNPSDNGRINFFLGEGSKASQSGSYIAGSTPTPSASTLMSNPGALGTYDVLMLPCEGADNTALRQSSNASGGELTNLLNFADAGGRVYASHYSYDWLNEAQTFPGVVNWTSPVTPSSTLPNQTAYVNTLFGDGATLSQWLALPAVGASTTAGQMPLQALKHDFNGVNAPTQSWLALGNSDVMQFTFNTPVLPANQVGTQCGRVLYNEYHVETTITSSNGQQFPGLCGTSTSMTPQEKLLEYMLFNLTSNGGNATLSPTQADFGTEPVGFTSGTQLFTWTNNSIFTSAVTSLSVTTAAGSATSSNDFKVVSSNCSLVPSKASCQILVTFTPTALGPLTGTLNVGGGGQTLTAALTGTGVPALTVSTTALTFGSVDVSGSQQQLFLLTNVANGPIQIPGPSASGDFSATTGTCGASLPAGQSCSIAVTFTPTTTGTRTGLLAFNSTYTTAQVALTGNGVDFSLALAPGSGTVIAGRSVSFNLLASPIAGYASAVRVSCSSPTPGTSCTYASGSFTPAAGAADSVTVTTTSQYTIVGYSGFSGGVLALLAGTSAWFLRRKLRRANLFLKTSLVALVLCAVSSALTGCGDLKPTQNGNYTGPGSYSVTLTATDGILTHSTTFTLNVTQQ